MVPQVVLPPERLAANVARVRALVRVRPLVDEQVVALGKVPLAVLADELLLWPRGPLRHPHLDARLVVLPERAGPDDLLRVWRPARGRGGRCDRGKVRRQEGEEVVGRHLVVLVWVRRRAARGCGHEQCRVGRGHQGLEPGSLELVEQLQHLLALLNRLKKL